jgi:molecular chaperone GrpE
MSAENHEHVAPQDEVVGTEPAAGEQAVVSPEPQPADSDREGITVVKESEGDEADETTTLTEELEGARAQAAEYLDGWQRARAEFANYRRRQEQQHKQQSIAVQSRLLTQLLPVIDDLERAFEAVPEALADDAWVGGILMVRSKWLSALERLGLSEVPAAPGDPFDPNCHEALTHEPSNEYGEGTVIQVVQRGYQFDARVLRPALVRVSSGAPEGECEQGNGSDA